MPSIEAPSSSMAPRADVMQTLLLCVCALLARQTVLVETAPSTTTSTTSTASPVITTDSATTRRTKPLWNQTDTDRLKHDLLLAYDKFARPNGHDQRTEVDLLVVLKHVEVDEFQGTMAVDVWIKMMWNDPKLMWKPSLYGNLSTLYVADHEIWQPDIMLYNSATHPGLAAAHHETPYLVVSPDGAVIWVPTTRLEVYCNLDLTHWPYDSHTCDFRMGSWVYDKASMDILTHNETVTHDPHVEGELWQVLDMHFDRKDTMYSCCPESYVDVSFTVTAQRRGSAYHSVLTAPLFAGIMLLLFSFFIPYHRVEKLLAHGINILMLTISLMYLTQIVPVLTTKTPLLVEMYGVELFMVVVAAGVSIGLQNMTSLTRPPSLPAAFKKIIVNPNVRLFLAGAAVDEVLETSRTTGNSPDAIAILPCSQGVENMNMENNMEMVFARNRRDWSYLALFCERLVFALWCLLFIVIMFLVG